MKKLLTAAALGLAGFTLALLLGTSSARAYAPGQMQGLGYSVAQWHDSGPLPGDCTDGWNFQGYGASIHLGTCDPDFQSKLDAFVNSTCPCAQTTASTSTVAATEPAASTPAGTTAPPADTTVTPSVPADTTSGTTTGATTTVAPTSTGPSVEDRLKALEEAFAVLSARVDKLEAATDAAWLAYSNALASGSSPQEAADIARGTALNLIYGLGDFSS